MVKVKSGQFNNFTTRSDGRALTYCQCRPPEKQVAEVKKSGYQTKRINLQYSGKKIDHWKVCLNKTGSVFPPTPPPARLGREWNQTEAGIKSVWTRIGNSNKWRGVWKNGSVVELTITRKGNQVTINRFDPSGVSTGLYAEYTETIAADGRSISGIERGPGWQQPWKAVIVK